MTDPWAQEESRLTRADLQLQLLISRALTRGLERSREIHVTDPWAQAESGLTRADQQLLLGALDYKRKRVRDVMTSLEKVFMLEKGTRLNFQTMLAIYKSGFTRIPVYDGVRQNIVRPVLLVSPGVSSFIPADDGMRNYCAKHCAPPFISDIGSFKTHPGL